MAPTLRLHASLQTEATMSPSVWGFEALDLHDAYWRASGIQCVRREEPFVSQRGHDLFMLLEPRQCVLFDLVPLANQIAWNRAPLSRIRVASAGSQYTERIVETPESELLRISREYDAASPNSCRVLLTRRASLAQVWADSNSRRGAWTDLRRFIDWTRTDHFRVKGDAISCETPQAEKVLIERLIATWEDPAKVIEGLVQLRPGIWGIPGTSLEGLDRVVGPVWIGQHTSTPVKGIAVGPLLIDDDEQNARSTPTGVRLLEIDDIREGLTARHHDRDLDEMTAYAIIKRAIDFSVALVVLILLAPIMLGIAVAVVVNVGLPIFFGHVRQTKGGHDFKCWKFRTMLRNAEALVPTLKSEDLADGPQVNIKNDPRITRIGHLLRRTHLDELPQFWNVLVGDMSLVGPRPSPDRENQFCPAWREARLSVRPGLTGLWQIERTRAPGMDFQEWIKYDIEYVNRASLLLDLRICCKTVIKIVRGWADATK